MSYLGQYSGFFLGSWYGSLSDGGEYSAGVFSLTGNSVSIFISDTINVTISTGEFLFDGQSADIIRGAHMLSGDFSVSRQVVDIFTDGEITRSNNGDRIDRRGLIVY